MGLVDDKNESNSSDEDDSDQKLLMIKLASVVIADDYTGFCCYC